MAHHSPEAERALAGAAMVDRRAIDRAGDIAAEDFFDPCYRQVWQAATDLAREGKATDIVSVYDRLRETGSAGVMHMLEGRKEDLATVAEAGYGWDLADVWAAVVRKDSIRRKALLAAESLKQRLLANESPAEVLTEHRAQLDEISTRGEGLPPSIGETIDQAYDVVAAKASGKHEDGIAVGIARFDALIGPLRASRVIVVAARPGIGKTAFGVGVGLRAAKRGHPVLIFSLEMTRQELLERVMSQEAHVSGERIDRGDINPLELRNIERSKARLAGLPLWIDDKVRSADEIHALGRAWRARHATKTGLVVVDYLGLIKSPAESERRSLEVGRMVWTMKRLAKDIACPVILISQLNREPDKEQREPRLSDLRDSGEIEQHAHTVIFPHRPPDQTGAGPATLIVAKNRGGKTGRIPCYWHAETMNYVDLAT